MAVLHDHCAAVDRDPATVEVTHLGGLLLGADPADVHDRVERLRPSDVGPDRYADRVGAGTVDDHEARCRALATVGVRTAIVSVPGLDRADAIAPFASLIGRFAGP